MSDMQITTTERCVRCARDGHSVAAYTTLNGEALCRECNRALGTRDLTPLEEVMESVTNRARALEAVVAAAQAVVDANQSKAGFTVLTLDKLDELKAALNAMKKL